MNITQNEYKSEGIYIRYFLNFKIPKPLKKGQRYCIPSGKDTDELAQIFKRANKYVHAIGGELAHDIWFDKKVVEEIKKAVERGVEIKIACGPRFDVANFEIAKMANEGKISFLSLKVGKRHIILE